MSELAQQLRAIHAPALPHDGEQRCEDCGDPWPCLAARTADALDECEQSAETLTEMYVETVRNRYKDNWRHLAEIEKLQLELKDMRIVFHAAVAAVGSIEVPKRLLVGDLPMVDRLDPVDREVIVFKAAAV
jgi:hypothetical protein